MDEPNVYGENKPAEEVREKEGIREETAGENGVREILDKQRKKDVPVGGGMGREETPKDDDAPQGEWGSTEEQEATDEKENAEE
jgi:hypothetical protein